MSVVMCMTLYDCYMEIHAADSKHKKDDMRRIQVELAVAAKSAGACAPYAWSCSGAAGMAQYMLIKMHPLLNADLQFANQLVGYPQLPFPTTYCLLPHFLHGLQGFSLACLQQAAPLQAC
jgi:hypothetical protein